jgi:hypothetical protein
MKANTLEKAFSIERVALLLRNRIIDEAPAIGIGAAIVFANNLFVLWGTGALVQISGNSVPHAGTWIEWMVLGGLLIAGYSFKGMHDGKAGTDWILLPATPTEKYTAAFLNAEIVYPVAAAILSALLAALLSLIGSAFGVSSSAIWPPFNSGIWQVWANYAIGAAVLMAGSATFRKIALLKSLGAAAIFIVALFLALAGAFWILFGSSVTGSLGFWMTNGAMKINGSTVEISQRAQDALKILFDVAYYALLPLFAVSFGAFKVIEKEGRDEVQ